MFAAVSVIVIGTRYIRLSDKECLCIICHVSHLINTLIVVPDEKNHQNQHKYVGGFRSRNHTVNYIGKLIACLFVSESAINLSIAKAELWIIIISIPPQDFKFKNIFVLVRLIISHLIWLCN